MAMAMMSRGVKPRSTLLAALDQGESGPAPPEPADGGGNGAGPDGPERSRPPAPAGRPVSGPCPAGSEAADDAVLRAARITCRTGFSYANLERVRLVPAGESQAAGRC